MFLGERGRGNGLEFRESNIFYFSLSVSLRQSVEAGRWAVSPGGVATFQNPQDLEESLERVGQTFCTQSSWLSA